MVSPGTLLGGRYRLVARLGKGGMGEVWEAVQEDLGRRVAVKVLLPELALEPELLTRLQREAQAAATLGHPNIVQITDFVSAPGEPPFLVMELLQGRSFAAAIEAGPMREARVAFIAAQVLDALSAAHRAGIVHRDIKPDNVFLTSIAGVDDVVRVLDFGIAKLFGEGEAPKLTMTGAVMGTPQYMAPEQARGLAVDARTDLFAVGSCMYQALTGRLPFNGSSFNALLFAIAEEPAPPPSSVRPDVDPRFSAVIERALAKDPGQRFASADEMRAALAPWLPGATSAPTLASVAPPAFAPAVTLPQADRAPLHAGAPVAAPTSPRRRASIAILALFGVLLMGLGVPLALYAGGAFDDPPPKKVAPKKNLDVEPDPEPTPKKPAAEQPNEPKTEEPAPKAPKAKDDDQPGKAAAPAKGASTPAPSGSASAQPAPTSTSTSSSTSTSKPSKQTGGKTASLASMSTNNLYEVAKVKEAGAAQQAAVNACYGPLEWHPVDHQFENWLLTVDAAGNVVGVGTVGSAERCAPLDACMTKVFKSFKLGPPIGAKGGTMTVGYTSRAPWNP